MINIKKLMKNIKEIGDSDKAIVPMGLQKYIEDCGEDHAIIVVKNNIVDEIVFTDDENELFDLHDAVEDHIFTSHRFTDIEWALIDDEKRYVTWGVSIFVYKEK